MKDARTRMYVILYVCVTCMRTRVRARCAYTPGKVGSRFFTSNLDSVEFNSATVETQEDEPAATTNPSSAEQLSVRERMQRFNRIASETDPVARSNTDAATPVRRRADKVSKTFCVSNPSSVGSLRSRRPRFRTCARQHPPRLIRIHV